MRFNWPLINDNITKEDKQAVVDFISQPNVRLTNGPKVKEFEKQWSEWLGVKHSVFVNSGASGNYIMSSLIKETRGAGEVIVPPLGWVSDIAPLVNLGMTPVFVDIDMSNLAITAEKIEKAINENTKAIVLVHVLGFNALSDEILKLAKKHDLFLIEDCCESHGATHNGNRIGSYGDVSNFSFYFGHHITTIEGGMVCTNDDELYDYIKMFRSHGMTREASQQTREKYEQQYPDLNPLFTFAVPGYNMRSCEINAVIGLEQIKRLDYNISKRVENLHTWLDSLDSEKYWTEFNREGNSNFSLPLVLKKGDKALLNKICSVLEDEKVEYRLGTAGGGSQARQPYLQENRNSFKIVGNLENVNHIHDFALYVGNHTDLDRGQILNLCEKINGV